MSITGIKINKLMQKLLTSEKGIIQSMIDKLLRLAEIIILFILLLSYFTFSRSLIVGGVSRSVIDLGIARSSLYQDK